VIAGIADIARDRKTETAEPTPSEVVIAQTHANLGSPGMGWDTWGGGKGIAGIAEIGHRRGRRCHTSMAGAVTRKDVKRVRS
jgi:hypothetical protein